MGLLTMPHELTVKQTYAGLIYGQPGVGKTTLALSSVNPICIDADQGMYRVDARYRVPSLQMTNYESLLELLNSKELDGFDTIVIDTLGKLIDRTADYVMDKNPKTRTYSGAITMHGWGHVKVEFKNLIKLINGKNKSVLFVAHEKEDKEGDITKKRPDVSGSAGKEIVKELDFMGYMEMHGDKRTISFMPNSAYYAKNSLGLENVITIPNITQSNSFIKDVIVAALQKKKTDDEAQAKPYDELIKKINGLVIAVKNIDGLNKAYKEILTFEHIWDSKIYAKQKVMEKVKELNAEFDAKTGEFIPVRKSA